MRLHIQAKILLVVIPLAVVPLLGLGWQAYSQLLNSSEQRSIGQMTTLLDQLTENIDTRFNVAQANAKLFANASLVRNYILNEDEDVRYQLLMPPLHKLFRSYLHAFPDYYEIRILLPDGYEDIRTTLQHIPNITEEEAETPLFQSLINFEGAVLSEVLNNPDNNEVSLQVARPLRMINTKLYDPVSSKPVLWGYLIVTMGLDFIAEQVKTNRIGEHGVVFLMDQNGKILFHPDESLNSTLVDSSLLTDLQANVGRAVIFGNYRNKSSIFSTRTVHQDLMLVGVLAEEELLADSRELGSTVFWITLISVLLTSIFLLYALRKVLVRPVQHLMWVAREIGRGNMTPEIGVTSNDELGKLATTLQDMGRNLEESRDKIQHLAYHDSLTGLPNRLMFREFLQQMIGSAKRENNIMAVLFLDLDHFKRVNDTLGHQVGDQLLKEMADRLSSVLREEDVIFCNDHNDNAEILARLGGDEFIILLPRIEQPDDAARVASRILEVVKDPFNIKGHELHNGVSIGITLYPNDGIDANELVKRADVAMYHAKEEGRNNYQYYSESLNEASFEHMALENKLRYALQNDEMQLHYQPQVETDTGRIVGLEALLRWNNPELGMVRPDQFIPVAEAGGLILPLGEWVIREACRQNSEWLQAGLPEVIVSVNVSGVQFQRQDLAPIIKTALQETGLEPRLLEVEVTETALMQTRQDVIDKLTAMKRIGLSISMDDFGTGYSSLNYLRMFPIDKLKIDRSFVTNMESEKQDASIVSAILSIAASLNLKTTAEGVETPGQLAMMKKGGCDYIQGFLFSRPVPAEDIPKLLLEQPFMNQCSNVEELKVKNTKSVKRGR